MADPALTWKLSVTKDGKNVPSNEIPTTITVFLEKCVPVGIDTGFVINDESYVVKIERIEKK